MVSARACVHLIDINSDSERTAPNCRFIVDDIESDWPEEIYDYIHQRSMGGSVSDWDKLFRQAFDHLRPGGYYEIQEMEFPLLSERGLVAEDSAIMRFLRHLDEAGKLAGLRYYVAKSPLEGELIRAGFEEVKHDAYMVSTTAG